MIDEDAEIAITPEMQQALITLCARRSSMTEDAFADALCEVFQIPRELLVQATVIELAGMGEDVEAGQIGFDEAFRLATVKN